MKLIAAVMLFVGFAAHAAEQPVYQIVQLTDTLEVRRYEPFVVAEVVVAAAEDEAAERAFSMLVGYIYGQNSDDRKFELTSPVMQMTLPSKSALSTPTQSEDRDELLVQFLMPKAYPLSALPRPLDPRVKLREVPSQRLAVIQYSGSWSQSNYGEHLEILKQALANAGIAIQGEPIFARYDSSFTPWFLRTNEIWLKVQ
jgi:hypothetical protein